MRALACLVVSLLLLPAAAHAQAGKTLRLVSGVTPGSASDTVARLLTDKLQAQLGQPVIVENRLGAGGVIAAAYVAKAEPDGPIPGIASLLFGLILMTEHGTAEGKSGELFLITGFTRCRLTRDSLARWAAALAAALVTFACPPAARHA